MSGLCDTHELGMHRVVAVRVQLVCSSAGCQAYVLRFVLGKQLLLGGTRA
jgi:hypothetical protein